MKQKRRPRPGMDGSEPDDFDPESGWPSETLSAPDLTDRRALADVLGRGVSETTALLRDDR